MNGINPSNIEKSKSLYSILEDYSPDIFMVQEAKVNGENESNKRFEIMYPKVFDKYDILTNSSRGYSGTITLINKNFCYKSAYVSVPVDSEFDKYNNNRIQIIFINNLNLVVINTYIPNSGDKLVRMKFKQQWMDKFSNLIIKPLLLEHKNIIICGDMNVVPSALDIKNYTSNHNISPGCTDLETMFYDKFLNETNMKDVAVSLNKRDQYTFYGRFSERNKMYNAGWRLDHFWVTESINILDYNVLKYIKGSDHVPIELKISTNNGIKTDNC